MILVSRLNRLALAALMFSLFGIILVEITLRFFGTSLNYSWEIGSYLMAAIFFMGCTEAIAADEHIRIQVPLTQNPVALRWMERASDIILALALLGLALAFASDILRDYSLNSNSFTRLQVPLYAAKLPVLVGAVLSLTLHIGRMMTRHKPND